MAVLCVAVGAVWAEDVIPAKMSLSDAITAALEYNALLKQADVQQKIAESNLRIAQFSTEFGIGSRASLERTPEDKGMSGLLYGNVAYENMLGTTAEIDMSPFGLGNNRGSLGLAIKQPLTQGRGLLSAKANKVLDAQSDTRVQGKEYFLKQQATAQGVISAYYRAVLAHEQVKVRENALSSAKDNETRTRKLVEAQLVRGIDLPRAEIQVAEMTNQLNLAHEKAKGAIDQLMVAIGTGVGSTTELTDGVPEANLDLPPINDAIDTALARRSEIEVYDEQLTNQERRLAVAEDQLRPGLDAVARFDSTNEDSGVLSKSLMDAGSFTVGFEYRLPFDKRRDLEQREIVKRDLSVLQDLRALQRERIIEDVRGAYRSIDSAKASLEIYTQNLAVTEKNLYIAKRLVEEGEDDNRNVIEAQEALAGVQSSINAAKIDLYLAVVDLKYAIGEDLTGIGTK